MPEQNRRETAANIVAAERLQFANIKSVSILKEFVGSNGTPVEILHDLVFLNMSESIHNKTITGTLSYNDIKKVFDLTPFTGNELVFIDLESKRTSWTKTLVFKVISVNKKKPENQSFGTVTMTIADIRNITLYNEFSTSFLNQSIGQFIKDFAQYNLGTPNSLMDVDDTDGTFSFAFPYQKFVYILKYLNKFAKSASNGGIGYYFFSNVYWSGFRYKSLKTLLTADPIYAMNEVFAQDILYPDVFWQSTRVSNLDIKVAALERGLGSTQFYINPDGTTGISEAKYSQVITTLNGTGEYGYITQLDMPTSFNYYDSNKLSVGHKLKIVDFAVRYADRVVIKCKGSIERMCGEKVTLKFLDRTLPKGNYDLEKTGDYLLESINHIFSRNTYEQLITAIRIGSKGQYSPDQVHITG
jgi:hypothetical protein